MLGHRPGRDARIWGVVIVALGLVAGGDARAAPMPDSFAPLVERVKPAVVLIATTALRPSDDDDAAAQGPTAPSGSPFQKFFNDLRKRHRPQAMQRLTALGSGFIIDPAGLVVTNRHVVGNSTDIQVTLQDGTVVPAKLVGHDAQTDLALLQIETDRKLP